MTSTEFLFVMPGGTEWILIFCIIILFFGAKKIPALMKGIGQGIKEFKITNKLTKEDISGNVDGKS